MHLPKQRANLYAVTRRNRSRLADLSDDLKLHSTIVNERFQVRNGVRVFTHVEEARLDQSARTFWLYLLEVARHRFFLWARLLDQAVL